MPNFSLILNDASRSLACLWTFALAALLLGCGKTDYDILPVSGQVTYRGEKCPAGGTVFFTPESVEGGNPHRPATADFKEDGHFRVTSFKPGDGLIPGRYRIMIECWLEHPAGYHDPGKRWGPGTYELPQPVEISNAFSGKLNIDIP